MTVVNPKSISGINSITTGSGSDNLLTIHTNEGTERVRVDSTGTTKIVTGIVTTLTATTGIVTTLTTNTLTANSTTKVGSGITLSPDGDIFATGVTTTGSLVSSGAISGTTGTFTVGTNKNAKFYAASHNDETDLGAGLGFSRQSDGSELISGIFGHSNSGLGVAARNHITFLTGGTSNVSDTEERLRIVSDGYVGIGTDNPNALLHVYGNRIKSQVNLSNTNTNQAVFYGQAGPTGGSLFTIRVADAGDDNSDWDIKTNANEDLKLSIGGDTERVRIESAGNVKIEKNLNVVGVCTANTVEDSIGDLRKFPVTAYGSNVVVASHHAGKTLTNTSGGWTVNASTDFATGEVMRVVNKSGSSQTVFQGGTATLYSSRDNGTSGDHSIKARGSAILICTGTDEYYLSGDI